MSPRRERSSDRTANSVNIGCPVKMTRPGTRVTEAIVVRRASKGTWNDVSPMLQFDQKGGCLPLNDASKKAPLEVESFPKTALSKQAHLNCQNLNEEIRKNNS